MVNLRLVKLSTGVTNSNGPRTDLSVVRWRTPGRFIACGHPVGPQTRCTLNRTTHAGLGYTVGNLRFGATSLTANHTRIPA